MSLSAQGQTRISVVDVLGREVAVLSDGEVGARRDVSLSLSLPARLTADIYFVRVEADGRVEARPSTVACWLPPPRRSDGPGRPGRCVRPGRPSVR